MSQSVSATSLSAQTRTRISTHLREYGVVVALAVLVVGVTIAEPTFLSFGNLTNLLGQWAPIAIMAVGMTYVVITGGFDLSVGSVFSLCAVTAAGLGRTLPPVTAFAAALAVGLTAGLFNAVAVTILRVNPFIATLGSSLVISGITLVVTGNAAFVVNHEPFTLLGTGKVAGIPYSGLIAIGLMVLAGVTLAFTAYGQSVFAVGGNQEASRLAGIRTDLVKCSAYVLCGLTAGIAGCLMASQLSSAQANLNPNILFDVLAAVIVGGTALTGGSGAIWRTAVGVSLLATLQNGFNLLGVDPNFQNLIKGAIIIAALSSLDLSRFRRVRGVPSPHTRELDVVPAQSRPTEISPTVSH